MTSALGGSWRLDAGAATPWLLVGAGGFVGAAARHALTLAIPSTILATLVANVAGSFLLGLVVAEAGSLGRLSAAAQRFVATGTLSSFTTYSTFALQTTGLDPLGAVALVVVTYGAGFAGVIVATQLGRWST